MPQVWTNLLQRWLWSDEFAHCPFQELFAKPLAPLRIQLIALRKARLPSEQKVERTAARLPVHLA
jgi:hypothetical protein